MTESEFLNARLAINENFTAELAEAITKHSETHFPTDVGLWNAVNIAKGRAALQFQELQKHFEQSKNRVITAQD